MIQGISTTMINIRNIDMYNYFDHEELETKKLQCKHEIIHYGMMALDILPCLILDFKALSLIPFCYEMNVL